MKSIKWGHFVQVEIIKAVDPIADIANFMKDNADDSLSRSRLLYPNPDPREDPPQINGNYG